MLCLPCSGCVENRQAGRVVSGIPAGESKSQIARAKNWLGNPSEGLAEFRNPHAELAVYCDSRSVWELAQLESGISWNSEQP